MNYWPLGLFVLNLLTAWAAWSLRQLAVSEVKKLVEAAVASLKAVDDGVEEVLDDHESRLTKAEKDVEAIRDNISDLPTKADLAQVAGRVEALNGKTDVVAGGVSRIEGYFLQKGVERV